MPTPIKEAALSALRGALLLSSVPLFFAPQALAAAPTQAAPASPASDTRQAPPPSSNGVFPLAQIHAGMHGTAWTVFSGTTPESFGVDILGVLHNAEGPNEDLILARLVGPKVEYDGVVAGMSGSPVYIDGRLVGAISYRIGQFSKEAIAGITPIAQMLPVRDMPSAPVIGSAQSRAADTATADHAADASAPVAPIETPLVFTGFSPASLALWKQHAPDLGLVPTAGLGGSSETATEAAAPHEKLEPGSAVSALMVSGDMEIAATCTVTYLDAGHLLACGHPITQFGAVSMPMTEADVVATLPSPAGSFKIVNTGATVGAFNQDRQTAIGGLLGATANMIPVSIAIRGQGGAPRLLHLKVLDQADLTPTALMVSIFQALQESPGYADESSYRVHAVIHLAGYPAVEVSTLSAPGGLVAAPLSAALGVAARFDSLYSSELRRTPLQSVAIEIDALPGRRSITLDRASVDQVELHPGSHITLDAVVTPYRGVSRRLRIPLTLPASLPSGDVRLIVSDGPTLDRMLRSGDSGTGTPLEGTVHALNTMHEDDRLYVTLLAPDVQVNVDGRTLTAVPLSVANRLLPSHDAAHSSLRGETAEPLASVPLDAVLNGSATVTLRVE